MNAHVIPCSDAAPAVYTDYGQHCSSQLAMGEGRKATVGQQLSHSKSS